MNRLVVSRRTGLLDVKVQLRRMALATVVTLSAPMLLGQTPKREFALEGMSPKFWQLFDHNASITTVATGFGFTEGPVWDPAGYLLVSDEIQNKLYQLNTATGEKKVMLALGDPDGNTYDRDHRLIDCASVLRAVIRLSDDGRSYKVLADRYEGKRLNSPNDVVLGPDGALYFTDPTSDLPADQKQELAFKGVYRLGPDGDLRLLTKAHDDPNGLAFSPDGSKLYIDDSATRTIWVYDFGRDGSASNGRVFGREPAGKKEGVPDGMRVDRAGNLYVTGPKGIWVWSSEGKHLGTIVLPEQPANLAWGGADSSDLYITATTSVYKLPTRSHGFVPYLSERSRSAIGGTR